MAYEKTCRVCGKKYEACRTSKISKIFRWQDVSCSPECGAEYLRRIEASRESSGVNQPIMYNENYNGFDEDEEEEYLCEFGADEID